MASLHDYVEDQHDMVATLLVSPALDQNAGGCEYFVGLHNICYTPSQIACVLSTILAEPRSTLMVHRDKSGGPEEVFAQSQAFQTQVVA